MITQPFISINRVVTAAALLLLSSSFSARAQSNTPPECSLSKTNRSCQLVIDRANPVAPPTVQMYSNQQLTVVIVHPLPFERYFLDFTTGQATLTPDVTSNIVQALIPNLNHLAVATVRAPAAVPTRGCNEPRFKDITGWPPATGMATAMPTFNDCFATLATEAVQIYKELEPLVAPDSLVESAPKKEPNYYQNNRCKILGDINVYVTTEAIVSTKISLIGKDTTTKYNGDDQDLITQLGIFQKITDAVAADLFGYRQRISDLGAAGYNPTSPAGPTDSSSNVCSWSGQVTYVIGSQTLYAGISYISKKTHTDATTPDNDTTNWHRIAQSSDAGFRGAYDPNSADYVAGNQVTYNGRDWMCLADSCPANTLAGNGDLWTEIPPPPNVVITSRKDSQRIYQNMVTRTITYSLDALNLVSYSQQAAPSATNKKALATVAVNFADTPNSGFLGIPPNALRLEASAGVFFSTLPIRTFTLTSTGSVQDSKTLPTTVLFAAANYRLTDDLGKRWKSNVYLTGAAGINPNNTMAEFGTGFSYAWRAFMVSALCHFGHDVRPTAASLTSGSTSALPTTTHWTEAFAVGISVRIPSLTGR